MALGRPWVLAMALATHLAQAPVTGLGHPLGLGLATDRVTALVLGMAQVLGTAEEV